MLFSRPSRRPSWSSQPAIPALRLAGAAYLVFLGVQSIVAAARRRRAPQVEVRSTPGGSLRQGLVSNLANPKMVVFFASLLPRDRVRRAFEVVTGAVLVALGLRVAAARG